MVGSDKAAAPEEGLPVRRVTVCVAVALFCQFDASGAGAPRSAGEHNGAIGNMPPWLYAPGCSILTPTADGTDGEILGSAQAAPPTVGAALLQVKIESSQTIRGAKL